MWVLRYWFAKSLGYFPRWFDSTTCPLTQSGFFTPTLPLSPPLYTSFSFSFLLYLFCGPFEEIINLCFFTHLLRTYVFHVDTYVHTYYTTSVNTVLIQYVLYVQHHTDVLIILLILRCCCVCGKKGGRRGETVP